MMKRYVTALLVVGQTLAAATASIAMEPEGGPLRPALFIVPLGMSTYALLLATVLAGAFMKRNRQLLFPWHRRLALATLLLATLHGLLVLLAHQKL
jgi:hypothetical protein